MPLERRNEPQMLRQFHKIYPSYNLNPGGTSSSSRPKPFFALHTHRSSRTASAVRAGVSPATQLVAMSLEITSVDQERTPRKQTRTTGTRRRQQNSSNNNHNNNSTNKQQSRSNNKTKQQQPQTTATERKQQHNNNDDENNQTTTTTQHNDNDDDHAHTKQNANQPRSPEQTQLRPSSEIHKLILDIAPLRIAAGHLRHRCVQLHAYNQ